MSLLEGRDDGIHALVRADHFDLPFRILFGAAELSGIGIASFQRTELTDSLGLPAAAVVVFEMARSRFEHGFLYGFEVRFRGIKLNFVHTESFRVRLVS